MIRLRNASRLTPSLILRFKIKTNREQVSFVSKHETFIFWTSFDYFSHFVHQNISQSLILSRWCVCVCVERLHVTPASWQFGFISKKKKKRENVVRMSVCHFFFYIFNLPQGRRFWNCWSRVFFFFSKIKIHPPHPPPYKMASPKISLIFYAFIRVLPLPAIRALCRNLNWKTFFHSRGCVRKMLLKLFFLNSQGVWLNCCRRNFFFSVFEKVRYGSKKL